MWQVVSQRNGATCKHQVLLQIGENCNGYAWNVGSGVREGSREQKMCLRMIQTLSRREGSDWGCATFGSAIDKQNPRNDRESATNAGTRSATDTKIDCREIGHYQEHGVHHRPPFAGLNPPGVDGFFQRVKILSMTSFGKEVKPWVPCRIFLARKRTSSRN